MSRPFLDQHEIAEAQRVHVGAHKAGERLFRRIDHRFVLVERGVEHDADPGPALNRGDQLVVERVGLAIDALQAAGAIDMRDRRHAFAPFGLELDHVHHERAVDVLLEIGGDILLKHARRERTKAFPPLDLGVDRVLHRRNRRIGEDRAIAERARAPLAAALVPAGDLTPGDQIGGALDRCLGARQFLDADADARPGRDLAQPRLVVLRTPEGVLHMKPFGSARDVVPGPQRGTEAGAVVGRRSLQIGRAEARVAQQAGIGDAVERAAARHRDVLAGHQLVQAP